MANAAQFQKVKDIVNADETRKFIVVSACGKESDEDHKVTDLLYLIEAHVRYGVSYDSLLDEVKKKYKRICDALALHLDIDAEFERIRSLLERHESTDYLVSRGEYLAAKMLAEFIGATFVDARDVIHFRYSGEIDMEHTASSLEKYARDNTRVVIPGFYGSMPNGVIKIMPRGGSDITGAVIANAVDADIYENWTDVSGFMVADPRIIKNPVSIQRITYYELHEMSYMGANVLHDEAIFPVTLKNIPINIRNTNDPSHPGTMIMEDCTHEDEVDPPYVITGVTGKKNYTVVTLFKAHSSSQVGFMRRILSVFEKYNVSVEAVPTSVDSFSVVVHSKAIDHCLYDIVGDLREDLKPDDVRIEEHISMIAVVGREMRHRPGISGALLSEFGRNQINIRIICQSSYELSIILGVNDADFEKAIQAIYDKFILEEGIA